MTKLAWTVAIFTIVGTSVAAITLAVEIAALRAQSPATCNADSCREVVAIPPAQSTPETQTPWSPGTPDVIDATNDIEQETPSPEDGLGGPYLPLEVDETKPEDAPPLPTVAVTQNLILHPRWAEQPSTRIINSHFPLSALRLRRNGLVVLDCNVLEDGTLECRVDNEDPQELGFGAAALTVSQLFKVHPELDDGVPARGSRLRFEVRFTLDEQHGAVEAQAWLCDPSTLIPISEISIAP